jgi:branched-chain amino acid transport system permease protein
VLGKLHVTGGVRGMSAPLGIPLGDTILQGTTTGYSIVLIVVAGLGLAIASWIKRSYLGLGLFANRQNERLVLSAGLSPGRYRFLAVMISAFYGAVAGVLIGPILTILVPSSFGITLTLLLLLIVVVGGMGSVIGVAVAAVLLTIVAQVAQSSSPAWPLIYGLTVMVVLVVAPSGLGGAVKALFAWWRRRGGANDELATSAAVSDEKPPPGDGVAVSDGHPVLALHDVKRHYGGVRAVDGVSLTVRAGTVHGLIGPNGSGKTTLFDAISGFVRLTDGTIVALEHDTKHMGAAQRARAGMGRTFQLPNILPDNTVLENVVLGMLAGMPAYQRLRQMGTARRSTWEDQAMRALEHVGLGHLAGRVVRDLPYGHQRLVDLARVLVARPPIVLLDEPGAGISTQDREVVRRIVLEHRARGGTAVIVEHDMRLIMAICDRITVLRMGQVIAEGTPAEVARDATVIAAYLGDTTGEAHVAS